MARPYNRKPVKAVEAPRPAKAEKPATVVKDDATLADLDVADDAALEQQDELPAFSEGVALGHVHLAYNGAMLTFRAGQAIHADRALRNVLDACGARIQWSAA